jgi:hypothetical protein
MPRPPRHKRSGTIESRAPESGAGSVQCPHDGESSFRVTRGTLPRIEQRRHADVDFQTYPFVSAVVAAIVMCACSGSIAPAAQATKVVRDQCQDATAAPEDVEILEGTRIVEVTPEYTVDTCWGTWQVSATKLLVRPPPNVSSDRFGRALRCHGARALLGGAEASAVSGDPYWSRDGWVDVDVQARGSLLWVRLRAETVAKNIRLLHRASAFAAARR